MVRSTTLALALLPCLLAPARAGNGSLGGVIDLRYQRPVAGEDIAVDNAVTVGVRTRVLAGRRAAACLGLDLRGGLGGGEAVYAATLYPLGLGYRHGPTSQVALCAGVGASGGSGDAIPFTWSAPVELHWEGTGRYSVVRPLVYTRIARVSREIREEGSPLVPFADELHAAAGLRVLLPDQPVEGVFTGHGLFIGVTYDELLGARIIGVAIGHAFATSR